MKLLNRIALLMIIVLVTTAGIGPVVAQSAQQSSGQVVGQPDISIETSAGELTPGTTVELPLSITNRGQIDRAGPQQYETRVTTARGLSIDFQDENSPIEVNSGSVAIGDVPTGTMDVSPVEVIIPEGVEPGIYELPVEYEYAYTRVAEYGASTEYNDLTRTRSGTVTIEVEDKPQFEVVNVDSNAQVGDRNDVAVTLENTGTKTASDASVTAQSRTGELSFGSGSESSTGYVGEWEPDETKTVDYKIGLADDAAHRGYSVDVSVGYTDTNGIEQTSQQLEAGVPTAAEQSFALENITSTLRVGEDGSISGTVTNTGPKSVDDAIVQFADEDSPNVIPVERSVAVGSLESGESKSFRLPIEVSSEAEDGSKSLNFAVQYRNSNGESRQYDKLDVVTDIAPERDQFNVDVQEETIEAGGQRELTVEITNNLDQTVTDIEARLFADDPLDTGDDEGYVQSLEPGESVTMTFELSAGSSATAKTYPISFDFRYDDERGNSQVTNTLRVPIDVTSSEGGGLPLTALFVVGSLIAGGVGVFWYRRE